MKASKFKEKFDTAEVAISNTVSVQLTWSTEFYGLRWCVVQTHECKIPKWQFWRTRFCECSIYGPFPSRNQAVKFANYLARPL